MVDFLKKYLDEKAIAKMLSLNEESLINSFSMYEDEACKIIEYLKTINVNNNTIENLIIYMPFTFMMEYEKFVKKISRFNIPEFVKLLNNDFVIMDRIFQ